jgi:pimeloyl-ACP methyl ester carboxylesterase
MESCSEAARPYVEADRRQHMIAGDDGRLRARFSRPVAIAAYGEMARPLVHPEIGTRTLLLEASDYDLVQPEHVRRLRGALGTDFEHQVVKGGHSLLWDAFDDTSAAIARFLAPAETATSGG